MECSGGSSIIQIRSSILIRRENWQKSTNGFWYFYKIQKTDSQKESQFLTYSTCSWIFIATSDEFFSSTKTVVYVLTFLLVRLFHVWMLSRTLSKLLMLYVLPFACKTSEFGSWILSLNWSRWWKGAFFRAISFFQDASFRENSGGWSQANEKHILSIVWINSNFSY